MTGRKNGEGVKTVKASGFWVCLLLCFLLTACGNTAPDQGSSEHNNEANNTNQQTEPNESSTETPVEEVVIDNLSQLIPELATGGEICVIHPYEAKTTYIPAIEEQQSVISELLLQTDISEFSVVTKDDLLNIMGGTVVFGVCAGEMETHLRIMNTPDFQYVVIIYDDGKEMFMKGPAGTFPFAELNTALAASLAAAIQGGIITPPSPPNSVGAS